MVNLEHIEAQLSDLNGQPVIVIEPHYGSVSFSYTGTLNVTAGRDGFDIGFHICHPMGVLAIIFFAGDVARVEEPNQCSPVKKIIRLKGINGVCNTQ